MGSKNEHSTVNRQDLQTLAKKWMSFWQGAPLEKFNDVHSSTFVDYGAGNRGATRDDFRNSVVALYDAFPDFHATTEDIIIDEVNQTVVIRWTATGAHKKAFMGQSPTDKTIAFEGIEIIKCNDAKVIERWGGWDGIQILEQIRS